MGRRVFFLHICVCLCTCMWECVSVGVCIKSHEHVVSILWCEAFEWQMGQVSKICQASQMI